MFQFNNIAYLNLPEDALVEFIQVLHVPNQEGSVSRMNGEEHIRALVPLSGQGLHFPLQQHGGQGQAGAGSRGGCLGAALFTRLNLLTVLRGGFVRHLVQL